jgi:arylsulfatase A-like enzyme
MERTAPTALSVSDFSKSQGIMKNILLIITDQQSWGTLSAQGNVEVHTAHLDRLAEEGTDFSRCYCTFPLCTPARASIFTGMYPHQLGITQNGQALDPLFRNREIGTLLRNAGYRCGYAGKWHVPEISMTEEHGFERLCSIGDNLIPDAVDKFLESTVEQGTAGNRPEDFTQPFFLVAAFDNPHNICEYSHGRPMPWGGLGVPAETECPNLPGNYAPPAYGPEADEELKQFSPLYGQFDRYTADDWRRYRYVYNRLVEKIDSAVGRLLASLETRNLLADTVVIFTSDHGDMQGAHGFGHKILLYEESVRVPLIIRHPDTISKGRTIQDLISNGLDLLPTICDIAGIQPPDDLVTERPPGELDILPGGTYEGRRTYPIASSALSGESMMSYLDLTNEATDSPVPPSPAGKRDEIIVETGYRDGRLYCGRAVIGKRYKYFILNHGRNREQLYDLEDDPGEMVNLAVEKRYKSLVEEKRNTLKNWMKSTDDRFEGHYAYAENGGALPELPGKDWNP